MHDDARNRTARRRRPPAREAHTLVYRRGPHWHVLRWRTRDDLTAALWAPGDQVDGECLDEIGYVSIVLNAGQMHRG